MLKILIQSVIANLVLIVIVCGVYPLAVTGLGQVFFADQANGSLIHSLDGKIVGSKLIGQNFTAPEYFHGRPSAAGTGYDAMNSSGSNLSLTHQKFADALHANIEALMKENPTLVKGDIPNDLVTSSASGLDPDVSPAGAFAQIERVAEARQIDVAALKSLTEQFVKTQKFGFLGEPTVNVLELNLALNERFPKR